MTDNNYVELHTTQPDALRLADDLSRDYCNCLEGYKIRNRMDPHCESCQTKDWRQEAAAELRRLHEENERLRGIVPEVLERLNDELCDENEDLRDALQDSKWLFEEVVQHLPKPYSTACMAAMASIERLQLAMRKSKCQ